jgi:hypothetical protein
MADKSLSSRKRGDILSYSKPATREKSRPQPAGVPDNVSGGRGIRIYGPGAEENRSRKPFGRSRG